MDKNFFILIIVTTFFFLIGLSILLPIMKIELGGKDSFHISCEEAGGNIIKDNQGRDCIKEIDGLFYKGRGIEINNKYKFVIGGN